VGSGHLEKKGRGHPNGRICAKKTLRPEGKDHGRVYQKQELCIKKNPYHVVRTGTGPSTIRVRRLWYSLIRGGECYALVAKLNDAWGGRKTLL